MGYRATSIGAALAVSATSTSIALAEPPTAAPGPAPSSAPMEAPPPEALSRPPQKGLLADGGPVDLALHGELGFLAPLSHVVQFSRDGSRIDYVDEGGQDNLFLFTRVSTELTWLQRHRFVLLYQPLQLDTQTVLQRDLRIDGAVFPEGAGVRFRYGFPFFRLSYAYDFASSQRHVLAFGLALQIRNATIDFQTLDGTTFRSNRGIGPVPLLRFKGRYGFTSGWFLGTEVDGFYAPIRYINGGDSDTEGAFVDWSLRAGTALNGPGEAFLNVRYLGGGAQGTSEDDPPPGDGFTKNWLHFVTVSLGASLDVL